MLTTEQLRVLKIVAEQETRCANVCKDGIVPVPSGYGVRRTTLRALAAAGLLVLKAEAHTYYTRPGFGRIGYRQRTAVSFLAKLTDEGKAAIK